MFGMTNLIECETCSNLLVTCSNCSETYCEYCLGTKNDVGTSEQPIHICTQKQGDYSKENGESFKDKENLIRKTIPFV